MKIVVDAMGGDFPLQNPIEGALKSLRESGGRFGIVLTGVKSQIESELGKHKHLVGKIEIVDAPDAIEMRESPAAAVKSKPNSSMMLGLRLCKEGKAAAFVSAGSTGAQMAGSLFTLGRVPGVQRPTIGAYFPSPNGIAMVFDVGASIDCKPEHYVQFAEMGSIYLQYAKGISSPKVGLLNIGEEDSKGTETVKEAHFALREAHQRGKINFIGNVEGRDILKGVAEVIICDGFVGNCLLKFGESIPSFLKDQAKLYAAQGLFNKLMIGLALNPLKTMLKGMDYERYGGVPLLGVNGVSIICHGKSSPTAIMNAIFRAEEMIERKVNEHIAEVLKSA
jgi:glycerol-3-phosphate acyltransferase PlsX